MEEKRKEDVSLRVARVRGRCGGEGVEKDRLRNKQSLHSLLASLEVAKSRTSLTDNSSELWPFTLNKG